MVYNLYLEKAITLVVFVCKRENNVNLTMIIYIYIKKLNIKPKPLTIILYDTKINIVGVMFEVMGEVQGHKVNYSPVSCLRLLLELVLSVSGSFSNLLTRHSNVVRSICYNGTT